MITKTTVEEIIRDHLAGTGIFIVDIKVKKGNKIQVFIDKSGGISIDECGGINEYVVTKLDKDIEDYELEISSPGLGMPLKVVEQYQINIGQQVEVILRSGMKITGKLISTSTDSIQVEELKKARNEVTGKSEYINVVNTYLMNEIKSTKLVVTFK